MNLSASQTTDTGKGLKIREYVGYALGDTASNFFFQMFGIFLIYYYVDVWGIDAKKVAIDRKILIFLILQERQNFLRLNYLRSLNRILQVVVFQAIGQNPATFVLPVK